MTDTDDHHLPVSQERGTAVATSQLLSTFLESLTPSTRRAYTQDLRTLAEFGGYASVPAALCDLLALPRGDANTAVLRYRTWLQEQGLSAATTARRLAAVKAVVRLAKTLGLLEWTLDIPAPRVTAYRDTRGPGPHVVRALLAHAHTEAATTQPRLVRNYAILRLLCDHALRRNEVVTLRVRDVELNDPNDVPERIFVLGKGQTDRIPITLSATTADALRRWLLVHPNLHPTHPVFVALDRRSATREEVRALSGRSVCRLVHELGRQVGHDLHPHALRHAAITQALDLTSGDVRAVQHFSRHAKVDTVLIYDDARRDSAAEIAEQVSDAWGEKQQRKEHEHGLDQLP